jgi:hypothetical protein
MATYRDFVSEIVLCWKKDEAEELVRIETDRVLKERPELLREEARAIVMHNIGYMSGYLDREEAARILELFGTRHPFLGAIEDWPKTPEETVRMGMQLGERTRLGGKRG